jgi:hypothetical protein
MDQIILNHNVHILAPDLCPYGNYYDYSVAACRLCPIGTYQTSTIGDICLNCPTGYSTTGQGTQGEVTQACLCMYSLSYVNVISI